MRGGRSILLGALAGLVALGPGHAHATPRPGAPAAASGTAPDSAFLLATEDPGRSPSPFIGNGHIGVWIPPLGIGPSISFLAGLYEHGPQDVPRIASPPAWNDIDVFDGSGWLVAGLRPDSAVRAYRQAVDMSTGTASTRYDWIDRTRRTSVRVTEWVSRADPHLAAIRLELTPRQPGPMRVRFAMTAWPPPRRLALATLERYQPEWKQADVWYPGHTIVRDRHAALAPAGSRLSMTSAPEGRDTLVAEAASVSWPKDLPRASARTVSSGDTAALEVSFDPAPGASYAFTLLVSIATSADGPGPLQRAQHELDAARSRGYDALAAASARAWRARWESDLEIQGNPSLQKVVRSMLFYLLCSADRGTALGIPPMGLSSAGYYGHIFWDSDTWMFPPLLLTHPDIAHSLVAFRRRTLEAARANARANGYRGAMFPWEADELGQETTPYFAVQNAHSEIHISGDVALAQWQYYLATGDSAWLAREGFPVIRETADFWVSRASYDSLRDRYDIKNVVSVAEGLIGVTDDAYTNCVARRNLEIGAAASRRLGKQANPLWTKVAARLHLPVDSTSQAFRTYEGAPDSTLGVITPLLSFPLGVPMSDRVKRTHLEQALARLEQEASGAMMGITLLSVDAAELGERALVDSLLPYGYRGHLRGPFLLLSETPTNDAVNFLTGAGGFLQQVIFGWTGLRLGESGLEPAFPPVLPSSVGRLVLHNLQVRGKRLDVVVDRSGRRILPHRDRASR